MTFDDLYKMITGPNGYWLMSVYMKRKLMSVKDIHNQYLIGVDNGKIMGYHYFTSHTVDKDFIKFVENQ